MKTFDNTNLEGLRKDIMDALKAVETKHGIQFKMGNITYNSKMFRATVESFIVDKETGITPEKIEWDANCGKFLMKKEWFGQEFKWKGFTYRIIGIRKYADRFPVKVVRLGEGSEIVAISEDVVIKNFGGVNIDELNIR